MTKPEDTNSAAGGSPLDGGVRPGSEAPHWWRCDTHGPGSHTAWGCPECVREMRAEIAELDALRDKLAGILSRTAVALRGPEPPLTRWGWHDLPERAEAAIASIALVQAAERERCAKLCEDVAEHYGQDGGAVADHCALSIRA